MTATCWPRVLTLLIVLGFAPARDAPGEGAEGPAGPKSPAKPSADSQSLFDGKTLANWEVVDKFDFARHGKVDVRDGAIVQERGEPFTGIRWTGPFPKTDYEVTLEAKRVRGADFFCGMTFPVGEAALTLVVGGWGGSIVGLSSIDGEPAVENETCNHRDFALDRWYAIRLRVTGDAVRVWIDREKVIDLATAGRELTIYWEMEPTRPFGIATWYTTGAVRAIRVRRLRDSGNP
jgi:hypothetical protein